MAKEVTLPSGAVVTLRDPKLLRVKDRKKLLENASDKESVLMGLAMMDGLVALIVEAWSFDLVIPSVRLESLDELEIPDYDALLEHATEAQKILFPDLTDNVRTQQDVDSPFVNSKGSNG